MKKKIALLLVMTTLVLTACGTPKQDVNTDLPESSSVVESTEETPSSGEEVQEEESTEPEVRVYVPGTFTEDKYVSAYAGYSFTLPEGCTFLSEEELALENGIDAETFAAGGEALEAFYASTSFIIDFSAFSESGMNTNVQLTQMLTYEMTVDEYANIVLEEMSAEQDGMTCTVIEEVSHVEFIGRDCAKAVLGYELEGVTLYTEHYFFIEPTYVGLVTVTYVPGYETERDAFLAGFAAN